MGDTFYHDVILNRLAVFHRHEGRDVYYSPESFANAADWENIPVIYAPTGGENIEHPDFGAVASGNLPDQYVLAGRVAYGYVPSEGEDRLCAVLGIENPEVEQLARNGNLAISTGFYADHISQEGADRVVGTIRPNHVLVFPRGACPSCWSNDDGAMFLNLSAAANEETPMAAPIDNETRGLIHQMWNKICNNSPKRPETPESADKPKTEPDKTDMTDSTDKTAELQAANTKLAAENAQLRAEMDTRAKDELWNTVKATVELPAGWLGDNEPRTRSKFENNKDLFYLELIQHNAKIPHANRAEGKCACPGDAYGAELANVKKIEAEVGIYWPDGE